MVVNLLASAWAELLSPFSCSCSAPFFLGAGGFGARHAPRLRALLVGFGVGGGLWSVLSNLAFVRLFGTAALGEISGLNTALSVFAVPALGPLAVRRGRPRDLSQRRLRLRGRQRGPLALGPTPSPAPGSPGSLASFDDNEQPKAPTAVPWFSG